MSKPNYTYDQWRAISDIVASAMEYAHGVAVEHPQADPYWNLDTYVNQIIDVAFGDRTCHFEVVERLLPGTRVSRSDRCKCDKCGYRCARGFVEDERLHHCPNCGRRIEAPYE